MENITSKRMIIRNFQEDDWQDLYEYLSDEEIVKYEPYGVFSKVQAKEEAKCRSIDDSFYAVCLKETGKLIGNIYFNKGDFDTWTLGYVFNKNYHNKGYATESIKTLIDYAFKNWKTRRIIALCNPLNTSSWKLLERLNMRREGELIKNIYFKKDINNNPIWCNTYEYAILKTEWELRNK